MKGEKSITTKNIILILLLGFFCQLAFEIEQHTFTLYAESNIGRAEVVTLMISLSALSVTASTFIFGVLGDRRGRHKWLISAGLILLGVFTLLFGCANYILKVDPLKTSTYLILVDIAMSFSGGIAFNAGVNPWTCDLSTQKNRGTVSSILTTTLFASSIILLVLQGTIVKNFGFSPIFIFSGVSTIILGIVCIFIFNDSAKTHKNIKYKSYTKQLLHSLSFLELFKNKALTFVLISICLFQTAREVYSPYLTYYLWSYFPYYSGHAVNVETASLIEGSTLFIGILLSILFVRILNNGKTYHIAVMAVFLSILGLSLIATAKSYIGLFLALVAISFGYILFKTTTLTWFKNLALHGEKGQLEGSKSIFYMLIPMVLGSLIGQNVIRSIGFTKDVVVNGISKTVDIPTEEIFVVAAILTILTLIPIFIAKKYETLELLSTNKSFEYKIEKKHAWLSFR